MLEYDKIMNKARIVWEESSSGGGYIKKNFNDRGTKIEEVFK